MIIPITKWNPKNPMSISFIENMEIFLVDFLWDILFKISLSKKLLLSQFSQKEITIFFKWKQKQKRKKKIFYL